MSKERNLDPTLQIIETAYQHSSGNIVANVGIEQQQRVLETCMAAGVPAQAEDGEVTINKAIFESVGGINALAACMPGTSSGTVAATELHRGAVDIGAARASEPRYSLQRAAEQAQETAHVKSQKRGFRQHRKKSGK